METITFIGTYIIPLFSAAVGWLVGSRKRKNDFLKDLQASINLLSAEINAYWKKSPMLILKLWPSERRTRS